MNGRRRRTDSSSSLDGKASRTLSLLPFAESSYRPSLRKPRFDVPCFVAGNPGVTERGTVSSYFRDFALCMVRLRSEFMPSCSRNQMAACGQSAAGSIVHHTQVRYILRRYLGRGSGIQTDETHRRPLCKKTDKFYDSYHYHEYHELI